MLNVLITVDTEIWWSDPSLQAIRADFDRWFHGRTPHGEYGVGYQIRELNRLQLKANYFVEPLFASAVGPALLREMVDVIQQGKQPIELHLHSEWLPHIANAPVATRGEHVRNFSFTEQHALLSLALENLCAAGAPRPSAFRAGNYGANNDTLRALAQLGIRYDTSYNKPYLGKSCDVQAPQTILQPVWIESVCEIPVNFFEDFPGHQRHAQLTAISFAEMANALEQAYALGWQTFVIVMHSFELLNRARKGADPVAIRRFLQLINYLATYRDRFRTATFSELQLAPSAAMRPLRGSPLQAAWRVGEQALRRALYR